MNNQVHIVDREDQVSWYLDPKSVSFCLNLKDNRLQVRTWLVESTKGVVVISGQGILPRPGLGEDAGNIFQSIQRNQFKIYFSDDDDALLFKLTWGGCL